MNCSLHSNFSCWFPSCFVGNVEPTSTNRKFRWSYQILPNILGELGTTCFFSMFSSLDLRSCPFCCLRGFWQSCWPPVQGSTAEHGQHWQTCRDKDKQFAELGSFRCCQGGHWKALLGHPEHTFDLFGIWLVFTVRWDWFVGGIKCSVVTAHPHLLSVEQHLSFGNGGDNPQECSLADHWLIADCLEGAVGAVAVRQWTDCVLTGHC